jgi:hypothetical protein
MTASCSNCGGEFEPRRRSAQFCGATCRKRASRGASTAPTNSTRAFVSVTGHPDIPAAGKRVFVTLRRPSMLSTRVVPDARWPGMYRLRLSDGSLSDMLNVTRAKDALLS